ncbi:hypothetical protein [Pseudolysinimonas sp.]
MTAMAKFMPTPEQARKYRDYKVVFRESKRVKTVGESDTGPILIYVTAYRIPSSKTFEVFIRSNATADERTEAIHWGSALPSGQWACNPLNWYRTKREGRVAWYQSIGRPIADPLIELEIEIFRDTDLDLELVNLSGASR